MKTGAGHEIDASARQSGDGLTLSWVRPSSIASGVRYGELMRSMVKCLVAACALASGAAALAQDKGTLDDKTLPPLANPGDPRNPAREVFGRALTPIEAKARSIGYYWRGRLAGAKAL